MRGKTPRFVDKLPVNYLHLPLILAALPNARIVHLVRGPMDACFASFKQLFADAYLHSYEQQEMARHHIRYRQLMGHYRQEFPGRFVDVSYEDAARDLEPHARALIGALGLEWEDACLNFHESDAGCRHRQRRASERACPHPIYRALAAIRDPAGPDVRDVNSGGYTARLRPKRPFMYPLWVGVYTASISRETYKMERTVLQCASHQHVGRYDQSALSAKKEQRRPTVNFSQSRSRFHRHLLPLAVSAAVGTTGVVSAQTLEEVVVTATKREESVMDVPLAITALSGNFIADTNLDDVKDLISYTPGVSGNSQDSYIDAVSVRGVRTQDFGVGGDPSTAFFKNDLYEGRNGAVVTSLYDIERAEILRGPQGFLFGRNSIGGAFSVHTNKAQIGSGDGHIDIDLGERDRASLEGAINVPIGRQLRDAICRLLLSGRRLRQKCLFWQR
jgi:hypothetical protein